MKPKNDESNANEFCLVILHNEMIKNDRIPDAVRDLWFLEDIKMVHVETMIPTRSLMEKFCHKNDQWLIEAGKKTINVLLSAQERPKKDALEYGHDILRSIVDYHSKGSFYAIVLYGPDACATVNEKIGDRNPDHAKPGTLRAKYSGDSGYKAYKEARAIRNCIDCSENPSDSLFKIELLFPQLNLNDLALV